MEFNQSEGLTLGISIKKIGNKHVKGHKFYDGRMYVPESDKQDRKDEPAQ